MLEHHRGEVLRKRAAQTARELVFQRTGWGLLNSVAHTKQSPMGDPATLMWKGVTRLAKTMPARVGSRHADARLREMAWSTPRTRARPVGRSRAFAVQAYLLRRIAVPRSEEQPRVIMIRAHEAFPTGRVGHTAAASKPETAKLARWIGISPHTPERTYEGCDAGHWRRVARHAQHICISANRHVMQHLLG